jgi:hypothetical protein
MQRSDYVAHASKVAMQIKNVGGRGTDQKLALLELRGEAVTTSDHRVYSMDRTTKSI